MTRFISEANTQVAELQAGRIDIATLIPFGLAPTVEKSPNLNLVSITGPTVVSLRLNTKEGITKDVNVRKALIMGIDRDAIIKAVLLGHGKPIASFQSELSFGYDPSLKPLPFDLAKAKQMLQQAKVPAGAPVRIDFRGNDATFREVAQAAAGYLQALGLKPVASAARASGSAQRHHPERQDRRGLASVLGRLDLRLRQHCLPDVSLGREVESLRQRSQAERPAREAAHDL